MAFLGAIILCIPLMGILFYLEHIAHALKRNADASERIATALEKIIIERTDDGK